MVSIGRWNSEPYLDVVATTCANVKQGFGRIRISLLFRSVETRLPPNMLGWDVGTFEFISDKIIAHGYGKEAKLRLRTGGSTGKLGRSACHALEGGNGYYWDLTPKEGHDKIRLPVK
jgi:hypothetical protein